MTSHYLDIVVVPDAETGAPALMGALCDRLHRDLVQHRIDSLGISFPRYSVIPRSIGETLRLHGSEDLLRDYMSRDWLRGLRAHVRISEVASVPDGVVHRNVRRRQFKSNVARLRRRRMRRKGETAEQAAMAIPAGAVERPTLPYLHLRSLSTGQSFCMFIAMGDPLPAPVPGAFNSYGLGECGTTVPWF